jgi:hypothetical protein
MPFECGSRAPTPSGAESTFLKAERVHQLVRLSEPAARLRLLLLEEDRALLEPQRAKEPAPRRPDVPGQRRHRLDRADARDGVERVEGGRQDSEDPGRRERALGDPLEPLGRVGRQVTHRAAPSARP